MTPVEITSVNWFLQYGAPFLSGAFGVGVAWGIVRERLKSFDRSQKELKERVIKNEGKLEKQVGVPICTTLRTECQDRIAKQLTEIKSDIKENRDFVIKIVEENHKKMEEMFRFVGRATEVINRLK
uniref:Uncharacterized protein n=1 Tax=viral metagenome TaxID=1070528 RepID=A0A6H1ZQW0_9ZZZZ